MTGQSTVKGLRCIDHTMYGQCRDKFREISTKDRFIDARQKQGSIRMSKMWVEKHRPKTVRDIRGQAATVERLAAYAEGGTFPHLLLAGPPGTGKPPAALALCADVFGERSSDNLLEMNASDERKLESIRTKVKQLSLIHI